MKPFYESETTNWSEFLEKVREKMGMFLILLLFISFLLIIILLKELILFAGHVGSHCFNLNVPSSDTGTLFFFIINVIEHEGLIY